MKTKNIPRIVITFFFCWFAMGDVHAQGTDNSTVQSNASSDSMEARLVFLQERLDASRSAGLWWQWGWMGVSIVGVGYNSISAAYEESHKIRVGEWVETGKAGINIVYLLVDPMEAMHGSSKIPTEGTTEEKVKVAENLLSANAERAKEPTDWIQYAGNAALEGAGLAITLKWGRAKDAWIDFAEDMVIGSFQIWSEPSQPKTDWEEYQQKFNGVHHAQHASLGISPMATTRGAGMALSYRW